MCSIIEKKDFILDLSLKLTAVNTNCKKTKRKKKNKKMCNTFLFSYCCFVLFATFIQSTHTEFVCFHSTLQ